MLWRGLYRNVVSYFGAIVIAISLLLIFSLILLSFTQARPSPYLGIFTYLIFPANLVLGLLIFLYGMWRERRRRRRFGIEKGLPPLPIFDLNNPHHRKTFAIVLVVGGVLAVLFSLSAYNTYLFTDSVTFCGILCHRVMEPEYKAYLYSPHARVPCVDCHVGPGVAWYLRSKVAGVPQLFSTVFHGYPTPLPAPIENLRPARETCEKCHWPEKFFGAQLVQIPYFQHNEKNTAEQISFLVKTGGGSTRLGENAGIHWHMIINNKVYFRAIDREQQQIPWIKLVRPDGSETIYRDKNIKLSDKELNQLPIHMMDCINCHNRPTHTFPAPDALVDRSMSGGNISPTLPWIKKLATLALIGNYPDRQTASRETRKAIEGFYAEKYPEVLKTQKSLVDQAIQTVIALYDRSVFPNMKVNWLTYPNNIGHRTWPGCFVCHDGQHVNDAGQAIFRSCTACHTEAQRGPLLPLGVTAPVGTEKPWHPMALQGKHANLLCHRCHQLGYPSILGCRECHKISTTAPMMSADCNTCHLKEGEKSPLVNCRSCHPKREGLHKEGGHSAVPCNTCHTPHVWKVTARETCLSCHGDKKDHNAPSFCGECHPFAMD
jgi:NapC/NirT cytochrome c family, N-terminal region